MYRGSVYEKRRIPVSDVTLPGEERCQEPGAGVLEYVRGRRPANPEPPLQNLSQGAFAPSDLACVKSAYTRPRLVRVRAVEQELGSKDDRGQIYPARVEQRRLGIGLFLDRTADGGCRGRDVRQRGADDGGRGVRAAQELDDKPVHDVRRDRLGVDLGRGRGGRCWEACCGSRGGCGRGRGSMRCASCHRGVVDRCEKAQGVLCAVKSSSVQWLGRRNGLLTYEAFGILYWYCSGLLACRSPRGESALSACVRSRVDWSVFGGRQRRLALRGVGVGIV